MVKIHSVYQFYATHSYQSVHIFLVLFRPDIDLKNSFV